MIFSFKIDFEIVCNNLFLTMNVAFSSTTIVAFFSKYSISMVIMIWSDFSCFDYSTIRILMDITFYYLSSCLEIYLEEYIISWNGDYLMNLICMHRFTCFYLGFYFFWFPDCCTVLKKVISLIEYFWTMFHSNYEWSPDFYPMALCFPPLLLPSRNLRVADCRIDSKLVDYCRKKRLSWEVTHLNFIYSI